MISQCNDLNELHPKVRELALKLLEESKKAGLNIKIGETYRTKERQDYLYAQGRTRPGSIVTNAKGSSMSSYHQWRLAFDIFNNVRGAEYDTYVLKKAGEIGEKLGLEWGGRWNGFADTPHFQYTFGLTIKDLNCGKKPPGGNTVSVDKVYEKAVKKLAAKGIIGTPEAWLKEINLLNVKALIIRIGTELFGMTTYEDAVNHLVKVKVINKAESWLKEEYTEEHVRWLIKKTADYL